MVEFHFAHSQSKETKEFVRFSTINEETATKLMQDAHACIDSHLGQCKPTEWNPKIFRGNVEMIGHAIEQTCQVEIGED